jgi:ribosomal-protein-alanine N-acetyltransferase
MLTLQFHPFPTLTTNRLILRVITEKDVPEIFRLRSNENVMRYIDRPRPQTAEEALIYINAIINALKNNEGITWAISFKHSDQLIGTIGFWRIDKENHRAEIGYMLDDAFQRQGIMQEALNAVLDYGFNVMHLHSVEANINPLNNASKNILEKNSFVHEAHFRENYYYNGKFLDSYVYSLLSSDRKKHEI